MTEPSHAYPADLARYVVERLRAPDGGAPGGPLGCADLSCAALERLLSTIYQATLLREEERAVTFRLILGPPEAFPAAGGPPRGLHRLELTSPRPFNEHELRRLAPAAPYARALIGVRRVGDVDFEIWGILQSGPLWLHSAIGGRGAPSDLPSPALVVRASGPGQLEVARGHEALGELRGGRLAGPALDVFRSRWLGARFAAARAELAELHAEAERRAAAPWAPLDPDLTRLIAQQMVKRFISTMQLARHGGTVLLLPPEAGQAVLDEDRFVRLKYRFADAEPRRRYRTLMLALMSTLAQAIPPELRASWTTYEHSRSPEIAALDEAVFEMSRLIAGLAGVDGAVVMTKRFELLGFGGEIIGGPRELLAVRRALDLEGGCYEIEPVDGEGTRHRSAYRICEEIHDAVAIVVSHDGGVRFVAWHEGAVTFWDHVATSARAG